ncbi:MAG: hypothetical protein LQ340_000429 [Diploschistes diacapsis]|nr:MAG: hypothetical protein LQ340_000429 [Diploschistes diacapsis]
MSKLTNGASSFRASALSSSSGLTGARPAANSSPSPAPSQAAASGTQNLRNRQAGPTPLRADAIYSQPADTGSGTSLLTQIHYAVQNLKEKRKASTAEELISYLSLHGLTDHQVEVFKKALRDNPQILFDPAGSDGKGIYSFRSRYDIHNPSQLLRHLQGLPTFQGLPAPLLEEGWENSEQGIRDLESNHKLLVLRSRKDDKAKMVWLDDPTLSRSIDLEFRDMWSRIKLPDPETTAAELERNGLVPANKSKKPKVVTKTTERKPRRAKKSGRITNQHMQHLLKDFSSMRK